jgi:hypothetical protein
MVANENPCQNSLREVHYDRPPAMGMASILCVLAIFLSGCAAPRPATEQVQKPGQHFDHALLLGVWEVTGYRELAGPGVKPGEHRPNSKYCFTDSHIYRGLPPDAANDSADGWQQYDVLRDMIICTGLFDDDVLRVVSLSKDRLEVVNGAIQISLRRVARSVNREKFKTPVLPRKSLPVRRVGE